MRPRHAVDADAAAGADSHPELRASRLETVDPASYVQQMEIYVEACQALVENRPNDPPAATTRAVSGWAWQTSRASRCTIRAAHSSITAAFAAAQGTAASPWAADLLQFDLHDTPAAIAEYRALLTPRPEYGTGVLLVHAAARSSRGRAAGIPRHVQPGRAAPLHGDSKQSPFSVASRSNTCTPAAFRQILWLTPPTVEARATLQALPPSLDVAVCRRQRAAPGRRRRGARVHAPRRWRGRAHRYAALHARNAARRSIPPPRSPLAFRRRRHRPGSTTATCAAACKDSFGP